MANWKEGMTRTFEYWEVDPGTWGDVARLEDVTACTISWDADDECLGNVTLEMGAWEPGVYERHIRVYLTVEQYGVRERYPLGTFLVLRPTDEFDGMRGHTSASGYTHLKELVDDGPSLGYPIEGGYAGSKAATLLDRYCRAPVNEGFAGPVLADDYVADESDTWMTLVQWLLGKASAHVEVDGRGTLTICPDISTAAIMPCVTFDDDDDSILRPEASATSNAEEVPNVVEVVYSKDESYIMSTVVNDDEHDPNSTVKLGRRKRHRETSPELPDDPNQADVDEYARRLMEEKGEVSHECEFTHGFVPEVRLWKAVRLDYGRMGVNRVGVVVRQSMECTSACQVTTAIKYKEE